MKTFPVTSSVLSAKELGLFITKKYNLEQNASCTLFRTGINHTYFISDNKEKYALRVYSLNWRTKQEIEEEIKLLLSLKESGLSVSFPIPDKNKEFIHEINAPEGIRYVALFSFATGGKVRFIAEDTCFFIGSLMAKIHQSAGNKTVNRIHYNTETLLDLPYQKANKFFSEESPEMKFIKTISEEIKQSFQETNLKQGVVHLDMWYDNMAITDKNEVTIFDFDFFGNGWLILDIAYFCKHLFLIEPDKDIYEKKAKAFINGYQNINPISKQELDSIPNAAVAVFIFYLGVQSQRFDWSNIFLSENYLKMYIGRIQDWIKYNKGE